MSNNTSREEHRAMMEMLVRYEPSEPAYRYVVIVILCLSSATGIFGNIITSYIIIVNKRLHTTSNIFILDLCVSDFLVCIFTIPVHIYFVVHYDMVISKLESDVEGSEFEECRYIATVGIVTVSASVATLLLIAINRYIYVTTSKPTYRRVFTNSRTAAFLIIKWVVIITVILLPQVTSDQSVGDYGFHPGLWGCFFNVTHPQTYSFQIVLSSLVFLFAFTTALLYSRIFWFIHITTQRVHTSASSFVHMRTLRTISYDSSNNVDPWQGSRRISRSTSSSGKEAKVAKIMFLVFLAFCLMWLPYAVLAVVDKPSAGQIHQPRGLWITVAILAGLNSAINFIIYTLTNKMYRVAYTTVIKSCLHYHSTCCYRGTG